MKKISILLMGAMALGLFSCQDEKTNAIPQKNPQLPVMSADALVVDAKLPAVLDLTALNASETPIVVGDLVSCANFPEGYELKLVGEVGRQAEFKNVGSIELSLTEDSLIYCNADAFEAAYVAAMGKSAKPKEVFFRLMAYAVNGTAEARLGGADAYYCNATSTVTPYDLNIVIESGYGLLGTVNGWSVADAVMLKHSGLNPYDDPIFSHYFDISVADAKGGWWWKVVPQSTVDAGNWVDAANGQFGVAVNGDEALDGDLLPLRVDAEGNKVFEPNAGCIKAPGVYDFVADMENQTYQFKSMFDILYVSGAYNVFDWNNAARLISTDGNKYFGFVNIQGDFKLYGQPDYEGVVYGKGVGPEGIKLDGGNITIRDAGFYMFVANLETGKMPRAIITSLGLIGNHNSWGAQEALTPSADNLTWTGTVALDGEFKIRMNDNWDYNLGGAMDCLVLDGANLTAEAGTYDVTLDLSKLPFSLTLVKK
ncbi:MAG: hypothetical protein K2M06_07675 [Muribaculaceae bacterium]|nr:hypothetical protein [Muribaculaceae bacterium]